MESDDYVPQFSQLTGDSNMCIGYQTAGPPSAQSTIQDSYIPPTPAPPYGYCGQPPDVRNVGAPTPIQAHFPPAKPAKGKKKAAPKTSAAQRNQQQTAPPPQLDSSGYPNYPQAQNPYSASPYGQAPHMSVPYQQQQQQQHGPGPYGIGQPSNSQHYQQQYQQPMSAYRQSAPQQQLYDQARYPTYQNSQRPSSNNLMGNYATQQMRPVGQPDGSLYQYQSHANQHRPYNPQYHLSQGSQYGPVGVQQQSSSYMTSMQQNSSMRQNMIQTNHQYMQQTAQMNMMPNVNQHGGYSSTEAMSYGPGPQHYADAQPNIGVSQADPQTGYYRSQQQQQYAMRSQPDQYHSNWQLGGQEKVMASSLNQSNYSNVQATNWGSNASYPNQSHQQNQQSYCMPASNPNIYQHSVKPQSVNEIENVSKYVDSNLGLYANVLKNAPTDSNHATNSSNSALQASLTANVSLASSNSTNGKSSSSTVHSAVSPPPPPPKPVTPVHCAIQSVTPASLPTNVVSPSTARTTTLSSDSRILTQNSVPETIVNPAYQSHIVSSSGAPTSLAVVMPSDHRGPAVQLNIQPNSQPTTLITLYQLPPGSQPPTAQQLVAPVSQATLTSTISTHSTIPPEPVPTINYPTITSEAVVKSPPVSSLTPVCSIVPSMEIMSPQVTENVETSIEPSTTFAHTDTVLPSTEETIFAVDSPQKVKKPKKKRVATSNVDGSDIVPVKKKKKSLKPRKSDIVEDSFLIQTEETPPLDVANCSQNSTSFNAKQSELFQVDCALESSVGESTSALSTNVSTPVVDEETKPKKKRKAPIKKAAKPLKESKPKTVSKYAQKTRVRKRKKKSGFDSDGSDEEKNVKASSYKKRQSPAKSKEQPVIDEESSATDMKDSGEGGQMENYIEARRSNRLTKQKKYNEDWDLELDADDRDRDGAGEEPNISIEASENVNDPKDPAAALFFIENPKEEDSQIVDKLLAVRTNRSTNADAEDVEEFFVKYKNFSYLHCEWKTADELERGDKRIHAKIKRFRQKHQQALFLDEFDEDEPINTDFITVDRVLDVSTSVAPVEAKSVKEPAEKDITEEAEIKCENDESAAVVVESDEKDNETAAKVVTHYLVKWRGLPYEECTWELESDIDPVKIAEFHVRRNPPTDAREKPRPKPDEWIKVPDNVEYKNGNTLRDYQLEGINWLLFCWFNKQNCILADEMGLGKTIQTITFLIEVKRNNVRGPFLVIAPLSTIMNWQREFETWSDMNAIVYHGTFASRRMIQEYEMFYKNDKGEKIGSFFKFNVIITTYEMILVEAELLKEIPWRVVVIDEAHRLKNRNCKLMMGLSQFKIEHRVLLTGTPLQNNIEELFSLLNFLEPKQFSNSQVFLQEFGSLQSDEQCQQLQAILKPMMLRRLKEDVEKSLKPKEETIIEVELTNIQKKYYRAILERNFAYLSRGTSVPSLMNTMMELRKCCNHPFLINGAEEQILMEFRAMHQNVTEDDVYLQGMVQSSGKLVLIDKLLPRLRSGGHKVLVFSQMVRCLDILEDYLMHKKYPFERIDGNVRGDLRQAAIDRFCKPDLDRFIFLLCTRAGGLGINLTAADTVIIFDSDWNPQNDLQAQARCHRIGQEKFVKVYRLICRSSYEREMFDKASLKLGLDKAVLQSNNKENSSAQLSKKEIEELLRKGAYGALMDETNEGDAFCEEDIDQILQRRTHTITIQPGVKGSTFAKASFAVSSNRSDIDVNDPNFWQMWAKKANVDTDINSEKDLILYEPRQRKRRFDDQVYEMANNNSDDSAGGGGADSDSDTSSSGKGRGSGKNRRKKTRSSMAEKDEDTDYGPDELAFSKSDYFRVEKFLSIHGWGRWREIINRCNFKQHVSENDAKSMCRTVLLHCLRQYNGDEKIKEFIWELISPVEDGGKTYDDIKNHQGLFGPVPRRRKSRQSTKNDLMNMYHQGWAALPAYNPPVLAVDYGYQRHLQRHANKVLLRVRLLYYLEHEVISELGDEIHAGANADDIDINPPWHPEVPAPWWDREADKSLLIGIFKHGFENFVEMRRDPTLCFLLRCGSPGTSSDAQAPTLKEHDFESDSFNIKPAKLSVRGSKDDFSCDEDAPEYDSKTKPPLIIAEQPVGPANNCTDGTVTDFLPFPSSAELNGRFRKLITLYQRTSKVTLAKEESKAKRAARQEQMQAVLQERELKKLEERQRWSRREEGDFYRALVSFGVEQDSCTGDYVWERFKQIARLESKFDHTLSEYYLSFLAMCKRVCRKQLTKEEECMSYLSETLSEERANKVLQRIEFMTRIRETLANPKLNERIRLAKRTPDLPTWWEIGDHDLDLMKAVAKHGLTKSEENIVPDKEFLFYDVWKNLQKEAVAPTRAITRTFSRMSGQNSNCSAKDEPPPEMSPPKDKDDAELTISQILAIQTGGSVLQWPKERSLIFRLQNLCHLVEKGEWSSARSFSALIDADQRSNTPDTPALGSTPGPSDDTPLQSAVDVGRSSPAYSGSILGTTAASKMQSAAQQDLAQFFNRNTNSGRRGGRARKRGNPLQDLMEGERERMRALMHQSFLHQLEQFPFSLPLSIPGASSSTSSVFPASSSSTVSSTAGGKTLSAEEALNLSTKQKKENTKDKKDKSAVAVEVKPDPNELFMFGNLSADTRVPVINLRDGTRSTGKDAPTLRNLAQFLYENQHYMIDMSAAPVPPGSPATSAFAESELEPGEIVRGGRTGSATPSSSTAADPAEHVTVINRKNGLRLSGGKAPQIKNLSMWLDKNPDWDVDLGSSEMGKVKGKLLEKVKHRLSEGRRTPSSMQSANAVTPPATLAAMDPWSQLLASGVNLNDPFQMSLLFPLSASNPALMGLQGLSFGLQGMQLPTLPIMSSASSSSTVQSASTSSKGGSKSSTKSESSSKAQQKAAAAAAAEQMMAAAMNPFSFGAGQASSSGIFGLNPFLAASGGAGGMLPGFGISPNFAAMAQLQALMGLQSLEALSTTSQQQAAPNKTSSSTKSPHNSSNADSSQKTSVGQNVVSETSSSINVSSSSTGGKKLNALVNKILASSKSSSSIDKSGRKSER